MFYHLLYPLKIFFSPLNVFQYITFRSFGAVFTSFVLTFFLTGYLINYLRARSISQPIRKDGPQSHIISKQGTPTMGGIAILVSIIISTILWARLDNRFILWLIVSVTLLGLLGFADDYLKHIKKNPRGLSPLEKIIGQLALALAVAVYVTYIHPPNAEFATKLNIPYLKDVYLDLGYGYVFFAILVIMGASNGVNLTDGLDGLAIGNLIVAAFTLSIFAYLAGNVKFSQYLKLVYVPGAGEITVFLASILGTGLGFLWYNSNPAEIFMGDTGSLFLGGALGLVSVFIRQEILLAIIGGVFIAEVLSVILQVNFYKRTGKRIFRMAPIHHHFELVGWAEQKVTIRFIIVGVILSLIALASLKLR